MKMRIFVTLFVASVLGLVRFDQAMAASAPVTASPLPAPGKAGSSTAKAPKAKEKESSPLKLSSTISKSMSLVNFQDGSRRDGMEYSVGGSYKMSYGTISTSISYSQDLRDEYSTTANDWNDIPINFSFNPTKWDWSDTRTARISYSVGGVIPVSQTSTKKDQLQTSLSAKIGFSLAPKSDGFSVGAGLSVGQSFHAFEEDINGNVLNKYSSAQSLNMGYRMGAWSAGFNYSNRARWSYRGGVKSSFGLSESIDYSINDNISASVGHNNGGSTLKANGTDTNLEFINENTSTIFGSLSASY